MSSNLRNIPEISDEPLSKFVSHLAYRIAKLQNDSQTQDLENKEDIYSAGQDVDSVVKFHSLNSTKYFDLTTTYYLRTEPDGNFVTCMMKGRNMGGTIKDFSTFGNHGTINGDPILIDGEPFDYGIHTGGTLSTCVRLNRPTSTTENEEYIRIPDAGNMRILGGLTGFSDFIRFRLKSLERQGNQSITLISKVDDNTPDRPANGKMLQVTNEGRIIYVVKRSSTDVVLKQTSTGVLDTDIVYGMVITYTISGNVAHIYLWNDETQSPTVTDLTLSNYTGQINWPSTLSDHDTSLFRRGQGSSGYVYGDFYTYVHYQGQVVSSTQVQNLADNKLTIADIPFGQVQMENYWSLPLEVSVPSFDSDDFASDSFDV